MREEFPIGLRVVVAFDPEDGVLPSAVPGLAVAAEDVGFALLFVGEQRGAIRLRPSAPTARRAFASCFVALGAAAARSKTIQLGCGAGIKEMGPSLFAKLATGLGVCASRRIVVVLEPAGDEPTGQLSEALEVVRALFKVPGPSLSGTYYELYEAWNEPRPPAAEAPELGLYLDENDNDLLDLGARFCEVTIAKLAPETALEALVRRFSAAARAAGRLPDEARLFARIDHGPTLDPDRLRLDAYSAIAAGVDGLVLNWSGALLQREALVELNELMGAAGSPRGYGSP